MGKLISNNEYHKYKVEFLQVDLEANTFICDLANTMLILDFLNSDVYGT